MFVSRHVQLVTPVVVILVRLEGMMMSIPMTSVIRRKMQREVFVLIFFFLLFSFCGVVFQALSKMYCNGMVEMERLYFAVYFWLFFLFFFTISEFFYEKVLVFRSVECKLIRTRSIVDQFEGGRMYVDSSKVECRPRK